MDEDLNFWTSLIELITSNQRIIYFGIFILVPLLSMQIRERIIMASKNNKESETRVNESVPLQEND